jgi:4-amino-4-deoxy-L-arabinose transferase-like glycosyltransferase
VFVLYGGQVMTDVPSVLLLATALIIHLRGVQEKKFWMVLVGAGLMGLGVNLRETIGLYAPWLILAPFAMGWKFQRREVLYVVASCVVFLLLAVGWFAGSSRMRIIDLSGMAGVSRCATSLRGIRSQSRISFRTLCTTSSARRWCF